MISLSYGGTTVPLPDALQWVNEFGWNAVDQATDYSITGSLIIEHAVRQKGRPIVLQGDVGSTWFPRSSLTILETWKNVPGRVFDLVIGTETHVVAFDHASGGIEASPVVTYNQADYDDIDMYVVTFRFIEVA